MENKNHIKRGETNIMNPSVSIMCLQQLPVLDQFYFNYYSHPLLPSLHTDYFEADFRHFIITSGNTSYVCLKDKEF